MAPQSKNNPWDALFASVTRSHSASTTLPNNVGNEDSDVNSLPPFLTLSGGYNILIQHSMTPKSQRQWALNSTMNESSNQSLYSSLSLKSPMAPNFKDTPSPALNNCQGEWYGVSGPFLMRKAFEELSLRCDGVIVLVSLLGSSSILDKDDMESESDTEECSNNDHLGDSVVPQSIKYEQIRMRKIAIKKFQQNGAWVDLSCNPFGWDEITREHHTNAFITESTMNHLPTIAKSIREAAAKIESQQFQSQKNNLSSAASRTPIPIIFDSLTPLIHIHGVEKVCLFLQSFKQPMILSESQTTNDSTVFRSPLSPIVAPILYESIRPSDHRCLEDIADAFLSIHCMNNPNQRIMPSNWDMSSSLISAGIMDIVRRGGGRGSCLNGKLIHHCIPVHIMKIPTNKDFKILKPSDLRDLCYWLLDYEEKEQQMQVANKLSMTPVSGRMKQSVPETLSLPVASHPKIYIEDDDPEFDDYDEEDPDDDLDI